MVIGYRVRRIIRALRPRRDVVDSIYDQQITATAQPTDAITIPLALTAQMGYSSGTSQARWCQQEVRKYRIRRH